MCFYTPAQRSWRGGYTGFTLSVCPSVRLSVCRRHGFWSISQVCFGISISNFICMLMVAIGRSLLIFSDVAFKMAAWRPYWIFSCDQAALWMVQSVCPSVRPSVCLSVRPSVCHTFLTMFPSSYHHEIFRSYYQRQKWRPCKRSRSEVKGQGHRGHDPNFRFRTVTPVWIHIWWWNDIYSLMLLRRGALLFFKVIRQISRSHGAKIAEFDPDWAFPDCNSSLNSPMATKWCTKLEVA